jgi:hypothetical protein
MGFKFRLLRTVLVTVIAGTDFGVVEGTVYWHRVGRLR